MLTLFFRGFDALYFMCYIIGVIPRALTSLTKNSALAKLVAERLTTKPELGNGKISARHLIGFHKKPNDKDKLLLEYG